jgi:hypothetical protein
MGAGGAQKTVRFARVLERCGQPHVHTLWVAPDQDADLKRARAADRVLTIERGSHGKSDYGRVGFHPSTLGGAQFLIFPKSLKAFADARVVGIKFDEIEQPEVVSAGPAERRVRRTTHRRTTPAGSPPPNSGRESSHAEPVHEGAASKTPAAAARMKPPTSNRAAEDWHTPLRTSERRDALTPTAPPPNGAGSAEHAAPTTVPAGNTQVAKSLSDSVRVALKELQRGKTVAAFQRLERALAAYERATGSK